MFLKLRATIILALSLGSASASFAAYAQAGVESYQIETRIDGKPVSTYIHLFEESPLDNPKILEQISQAGLDHVVFIHDEIETNRGPSQLNNLEELRDAIETQGDVPVVDVQPPKGFFQKLNAAWKLSFESTKRTPGKTDYRYGLVSTIGESGLYSVMVFTSGTIALENGIGLVVAQTLLSYFNNVHNNSINHFLSSSWVKIGQEAHQRTYFFRNLAYDYITSQVFKLIQSPADILSVSTQSGIAMNSLMVGVGDVITSNMTYHAFKDDKVKLAKMNFYMSSVSTIFGSLDLMQHEMMPVIASIGCYDFRISGAILIGYYITAAATMKWFPNQAYRAVEALEQGFSSAKRIFNRGIADCNRLLSSWISD